MILDNVPSLAHVNLVNCHKLKNIKTPFVLVLGTGDNLFSSLRYCTLQTNLKSASFFALGSLEDIKLGYYHHEKKQHEVKVFKGIYEIASLVGSITFSKEEPFIHIHAGISSADFTVYGGHVIDAHSGPASEFIIQPSITAIQREFNPELGIHTICHEDF